MTNKILVAEDDQGLRDTLVAWLERRCEGVEILIATNREDALALIEGSDNIAVATTDLRMPDVGDGEAVAEAALQKGIKVIVYSGTLTDLSDSVRGRCIALFDKNDRSNRASTVANAVNEALNS